MNQIGPPRELLPRGAPEGASQGPGECDPAGMSGRLRHCAAVRECLPLRGSVTYPADRNPVHRRVADLPPVTRGNHGDVDPPFAEPPGQNGQERAGDIAPEARVVVGQENNAQPAAPGTVSGRR
jgi:hypothetical protein